MSALEPPESPSTAPLPTAHKRRSRLAWSIGVAGLALLGGVDRAGHLAVAKHARSGRHRSARSGAAQPHRVVRRRAAGPHRSPPGAAGHARPGFAGHRPGAACHRRPAVPRARRDRYPAHDRRHRQYAEGRRAGRLHADPAARTQPVPEADRQRPLDAAQAARGRGGASRSSAPTTRSRSSRCT